MSDPALLDGEAMHRAHPRTFWIAPRRVRENISIGSSVKVCVSTKRGGYAERIWLTVMLALPGGEYSGTVDSFTAFPERHGAEYGEPLAFRAEHVLEIITPAELAAMRAEHATKGDA